jgi:hypothetical protein
MVLYQGQKAINSDEYGLAPFDANKSLKKLTSWDSPTSEAEVENIKPLLYRIQRLKSAVGCGLIGTQLMRSSFRGASSPCNLE